MGKTVSCSYCGKDFSAKMKLCPFCGGEHKKAVSVKTPLCPRCRRPLEPHSYRSEHLDRCPECSGIWLDTDEFRHLTSSKDVYNDPAVPESYMKKPLKDSAIYIPCVRCGSLMNRMMFRKISGVIIDICSDHGVWLDDGELQRIRCFIADGGLEKYMEYLDNRISKNHRDIRKLAGDTDNLRFMQRMLHLYKPKYWLLKLCQ